MTRRSLRPFLLVTLLLAACGQSAQDGAKAGAATVARAGQASAALAAAAPVSVTTSRPPNFNIMAQSKVVTGAARASAAVPRGNPRSPVHMDAKLGVPTFMWAQPGAAPGAVAARTTAPASAVAVAKGPVEAARAHLGGASAAYGLAPTDVAKATATKVHDTGRGPIIVTFRQYPGGLEVFREEASVAMSRDLALVAISGSVSPAAAASSARAASAFTLDAPAALAAALGDLTGEAFSPGDFVRAGQKGKFSTYDLAPAVATARAERFVRAAGVKQVWFRLPTGLRSAWQVEVDFQKLGAETLTYGSVISATDGALLFRKDHRESEAYAYRVWASDPVSRLPDDGPQGLAGTPHPTAITDGYQAPFVAQELVTLDNLPGFSKSATDPWLDPGAPDTFGNNVFAYADVDGTDGPSSGDIFGEVSAPGAFDYLYDITAPPDAPASQVQAAITQLFYDNNAFHDWYYDVGFDEAAGNAQWSNYGRGGVEGDPLLAEAQDSSGTNNANMSTPPDGFAPRMQMYVWNNSDVVRLLVNSPSSLAGPKAAGAAQFGAQTFDVAGDLVPTVPANGCTALTNAAAVSGKIAFIDRGVCGFVVKAKVAQDAGATGVVIRIVNPTQTIGGMAGVDATVTIPSLLISYPDGQAIGAAIAASDVVNVSMQRALGVMRDGTIDNLIVAHEWGHYISNRLVQDSAGLDTTQARGMGEGFGDFHALLLAVRDGDTDVPSNATWNGVYGTAGFVGSGLDGFGLPNNAYYYGIRRTPYSTDMTRAPFTFKHMANTSALPVVTPPVIPNGSANSEVHNAGEVWATVLWECYAALLRDSQGATPRLPNFAEANLRMRTYLVAGYKLMPQSPTFLEGRDALLAAALAGDRADFDAFWAAFAKRGFGVGAVAPGRYTTTNNGLVESFTLGGDMALVSTRFGQVSTDCGDADGVLDNGEAGTLTVTLRNTGSSALGATVATIASSDGHLTFPNGPGLQVGPSNPSGTATATVRVALSGATFSEVAPLTITFPTGYLGAPTTIAVDLVTNLDILKQASATDTFEGPLTWTASADTQLWHSAGFIRDLGLSGAPTDHALFGPDPDAPSDLRITSPPLVVGAGPLVLSWDHAFGFEADAGGNYDGGVVELSADGGTTWTDIGGPLYGGTILPYPGNFNPLQDGTTGRPAFVDFSPSFAASGTTDHVSLNLGTTYAGQTVQVRFRIGSDNGVSSLGWLIDNFAASGLLNLPFDRVTEDAGRCLNRSPVAVAGADQVVDEGASATLNGTGSTDPDAGTTLTYAWTQLAGPVVTLTGASAATASFTAPTVAADTRLAFQLTVSDGVASSSATTVVTVHHLNRSPVASAGADQSAPEGAAVTLDATGSSDPDAGTTLCYAWTQTAGPTVILTGAGEVLARFTAPTVEADTDLTFQVSVCDGIAFAADTTVVRVLHVNRPPVASAGAAQSIAEGAAVTLDGTGSSDPDTGTTLTYAWTQLAGPVVTLTGASTASASFTAPAIGAAASLVFQLTVSDGAASSSGTTVVTVTNVNHPPVANAGSDQAVSAGALVTLDASASTDPDPGTALSYAWTQTAGPAVTLTSTSLVKPSFIAPDTTATLTFQVTVSDGVAQSTDTVNVSTTATPPSSSGCGCSTNGSSPANLLPMLLLGLVLVRRRKVGPTRA